VSTLSPTFWSCEVCGGPGGPLSEPWLCHSCASATSEDGDPLFPNPSSGNRPAGKPAIPGPTT
jgi:hypothetical protein